MGDVPRPELALVLAALTDLPADVWAVALAERSPGWHTRPVLDATGTRFDLEVPGATVGAGPRALWTITDLAEAQETLVARGLLPEGWCGDVRRGWLAWLCAEERAGRPCDCNRGNLDAVHGASPRTIPDLVALASLGWPAIQRAEELARAACRALREYGCPQPERVVWRVGSRSPADAVVWRDSYRPRVLVSVRGVVLVDGRLDVRPERRVIAGAEALWASGLALDAITADAVRIVVPPVGASARPSTWGPQPSGVMGYGR